MADLAAQTQPALGTATGVEPSAQPSEPATSAPAATQPPAEMDASITPVPGQNMLKNASFEREPGSEPPYWTADPLGSDLSSSWSTERVMSGQHSLFLSASRTDSKEWPGWFTTLPLVPGFRYSFDARYFTPDGAGAQISVIFSIRTGTSCTASPLAVPNRRTSRSGARCAWVLYPRMFLREP